MLIVAQAVILLGAALAITANQSGGRPAAAPGPTASTTPTPRPGPTSTPSPTPLAVAPLTGEPVPAGVLERPVVAVKIENTREAQPQAGLGEADVVFELLTEGGVTRLLALFQSEVPERVGPIRSARPEDAALLPAFDALLFMSGARGDVYGDLGAAGVSYREEDGEVVDRDPSRRPPHDLFATGADLFEVAAGAVPPAQATGWTFAPDPPAGAVPCPQPCGEPLGSFLNVAVSGGSSTLFTQDQTTDLYAVHSPGQLSSGATTPPEVEVANVVALGTDVVDIGCCDPAGNDLYETRTVGEGPAIVLRDGRRYEGTWSRAAPDQHVALHADSGGPLALRPGPTWVVFAPTSGLGPMFSPEP